MQLPLDGASLTIAQVCAVARAHRSDVSLSAASREQMESSRALIDRLAAGDEPIYAVNTGVGLLANVRIPRDELDRLQRKVIRSHCVGVGAPRTPRDERMRLQRSGARPPWVGGGEPLSREAVRAMILIRANVLAKG